MRTLLTIRLQSTKHTHFPLNFYQIFSIMLIYIIARQATECTAIKGNSKRLLSHCPDQFNNVCIFRPWNREMVVLSPVYAGAL